MVVMYLQKVHGGYLWEIRNDGSRIAGLTAGKMEMPGKLFLAVIPMLENTKRWK